MISVSVIILKKCFTLSSSVLGTSYFIFFFCKCLSVVSNRRVWFNFDYAALHSAFCTTA